MTDPEACIENVTRAIDVGYRHVDAAQKYGNEASVGEAIARADVDRDDLFVATKVFEENLAYDDVLRTAEESLDRLGLDRVDLLYVHWPAKSYEAEETLAAFNELLAAGQTDRVGVCNFSPALLDEARDLLDAPVFAHQVEMHPLLPQEELHAYALEHDHYLVAYSPIIRGNAGDVPELRAVAEKHGVSPAQVSLAWLMHKENVVPIPKASGAHIDENYRARELSLDAEDVARIDAIDRTHRVIDPPGMGYWQD